MKTLFLLTLLYFSVVPGESAISENICVEICQFCCRNQVCQTQEYCSSGDTSYYGIIGEIFAHKETNC